MTDGFAVPKALAPLLGDRCTAYEAAAIAIASIVPAAAVWAFAASAEVSMVGSLLLAFIAMDICGGVVANLTRGVRAHYQRYSRLRRVGFLAAHALHPVLAILAAGTFGTAEWIWAVAIFIYMLVASLIVMGCQTRAQAQIAAAVTIVLAVVLEPQLLDPPEALTWFAPIYLLKLVMAFSANAIPESTPSGASIAASENA